MASLALAFDILARDKASKEFDKVGRAVDDVGDKSSRLGSGIGTLGKVAGAAALGGVAVLGAGLISAFRGGLDELSGNQAALAQFEAGIKSTGGVANVTAAEMQTLADSIEAKTGTDGAAVVSGGALLATFTKVRDELGKGNDVFTRATEAGVDLAARGFGSVESNAVLLGKALNDPIKGLAALGKQGVTFTEGQKETIKSLVKTGDTLGAQKIILAEVEAQVGGSAEAYGKTLPGQTARAQHALDGVKETLVKGMLPAFTGLLDTLNDRVFPALSDLSSRFGPAVADFFRDKLVPAFRQVSTFVTENVVPVMRELSSFFVETVVPAVAKVSGVILGGMRDAFDSIRDKVNENRPQLESLVNAFGAVVEFVTTKIIPLLGPVLAAAFSRLGETIGLAIDVIGGIVKVFSTVKETATTVLAFVVEKFLAFADTIVSGAAKAFGWVPGLGPKLKTAATEVSAFKDRTNRALAAVKDVKIDAETSAARRATDSLVSYINSQSASVAVLVNGVRSDGGISGRAKGGPVSARTPYIVGEREPELFVPNTAGRIYNQRQMAALGPADDGGVLAALQEQNALLAENNRLLAGMPRQQQLLARAGGF